MDHDPPGSSLHGILQAGILECVPPEKDLPNPGIKPESPVPPALGGGFFTNDTTWEVHPAYEAKKKRKQFYSVLLYSLKNDSIGAFSRNALKSLVALSHILVEILCVVALLFLL